MSHISYGMERIRAWWPGRQDFGPPVLYRTDREGPRAIIERDRLYKGRWLEDELTGRVYPVVAGGIGLMGDVGTMPIFFGWQVGGSPAGPATTSLNSAYANNSTGNSVATRFALAAAKTLSTVYFWINSFTGTASNVNDLNLEVRTEQSLFKPTTASTVATATLDPLSNTSWVSVSCSASLSAGAVYYLIIGDADGNGTDFAIIARGGTNTSYETFNVLAARTASWTSANGFNTQSFEDRIGKIIPIFSDGTGAGDPFSASANPTNDSNQKGLYIDGLTNSLKVYGIICSGSANITGASIWSGTNGPGSSHGTDAQVYSTVGNRWSANVGGAFFSAYTLVANTPYRFVVNGGASSFQAPVRMQLGTVNIGTAGELAGSMPGGGKWYYTKESSGSWSDTTTEFPDLGVYILDQVAAAGGGGGGSGQGAILLG